MFKNKIWLGIILSIILLVFSINGFTEYYKYTQESGTNFYVGIDDKADALEDTNEMRQIIDDLGALLVHSKRDGEYPKDGNFGGTIQIPETGLKFGNAPVNDDIAAYIEGEMAWRTKAELGIDLSLYYLKTEMDSFSELQAIIADKTLVNTTDKLNVFAATTSAELATIISDETGSGLLVYGTSPNITTPTGIVKGDVGLGNVENLKIKLDGTSAPEVGDDNTEGYAVGSRWVDITNDKEYVALDVSIGAAVWTETTKAGNGAGTYLELTDTPAAYDTGKYAKSTADGVIWDDPAGAGDMTKAVYDTDADDIVDKAETVDDGAGNSSTAADVKDAITKKHTQNTDTALGTQTQDLNMGTHKIIGVVDPTANQEAATKKYVDDNVGGGIPTGSITAYGAAAAPDGWLLCDGVAVSRTTYATLFGIIGTTYGVGDGSTTFNVPNFKGKVPVGLDVAQDEFDALAETGGAKTHTLIIAEMPAHVHSIPIRGGGTGTTDICSCDTTGTESSVNSNSIGDGDAHNNLQPYLIINYIIKT